jgi:hypothetical protein
MKSLVRKLFGSKIRRAPAGPRRPVRLGLEALEERAVPATATWAPQGGSTNWSVAANWSTNAVPGSGDDVHLDGTGVTAICNVDAATASCKSLTMVSGGSKIVVNAGKHLEVIGGTSSVATNAIDYGDHTSWVEFSGGSVTFTAATAGSWSSLGDGSSDSKGSAYFDNNVAVTISSTASPSRVGLDTAADLKFGDYPTGGASTTNGAGVTISGQLAADAGVDVYEDYASTTIGVKITHNGVGQMGTAALAVFGATGSTCTYYQTGGKTEIAGALVAIDAMPVSVTGGTLTVDNGESLSVLTQNAAGHNVSISGASATISLQSNASLGGGGNNPVVYVDTDGTLQMANGSDVDGTGSSTGTFTLELNGGTLKTVGGSTVTIGGVLQSDTNLLQDATIDMSSDNDTNSYSTMDVKGLKLNDCNIYVVYGNSYSEILTDGTNANQSVDSSVNVNVKSVDTPAVNTLISPIHDSKTGGTNSLSGTGPTLGTQTGVYTGWTTATPAYTGTDYTLKAT